MDLKLEKFKRKNVITIPEEDIYTFSEKTLKLAKEEIIHTLNTTEVTNDDIEEFLISTILETTEEAGTLKEQLFTCTPTDGKHIWRVLYTNDVIVIDSYTFDGAITDITYIKPHTTLEIVFSEEDMCDLSFTINDESLKDNDNNNETLTIIRISLLLRLCFYLFVLTT